VPTYEYECQKCGKVFDVWQSADDDPLTKCEVKGCRGKVQKVFHPVGIIFKGSGWHITDYPSNGSDSRAKKDEEASSTKAEKTEKTNQSEKPDKKEEKTAAKA